jgi:predicted TIM-barrel fold metal-dependent hydrolase
VSKVEYCDPDKRDLAADIVPDELGYWWVAVPTLGRRVTMCHISRPRDGFTRSYGNRWDRWRAGLPAEEDYVRDLPPSYWDPSARVEKLDEWGIDRALCFFQWGMAWPRGVPHSRVDIFRANMEAWNRWVVDVREESKGRLLPVGHVTLRGGDLGWLEQQLEYLGSHGVNAALFSYGLIDGRRPSHPDHDRAWAAFVANGITPMFHTQDSDEQATGLPAEWTEHDDNRFALLDAVFSNVGIQFSLADMIFSGVFARFPELKVCCVESSASWIPLLLGSGDVAGTGAGGSVAAAGSGGLTNPNGMSLDAAYRLRKAATGTVLYELDLQPSDYLRRNVRAAITNGEPIQQYFDAGMADMVMFGGDYPHSEGLSSPREDFENAIGPLPPDRYDKFFGGNAAAMLGI